MPKPKTRAVHPYRGDARRIADALKRIAGDCGEVSRLTCVARVAEMLGVDPLAAVARDLRILS